MCGERGQTFARSFFESFDKSVSNRSNSDSGALQSNSTYRFDSDDSKYLECRVTRGE